MNQYEALLDLIINERKSRKLSLDALAEMGSCYRRSIAAYLKRERRMPADVMFECLIGLGFKLEVNKL